MRLAFVILFTCFFGILKAQKVYHIAVSKATLFSLPNESSNTVKELTKGTEVTLVKNMESGSWMQVQYKGAVGYIQVSKVKEGKYTVKSVAAKSKKYHVSVFQSALYKTKSFSGAKLKTLKENDIVEVIGKATDWGQVKTSTGLAYVYMAHLTEGQPKKKKPIAEISTQTYVVKYDTKGLEKPSPSAKAVKKFSGHSEVQVATIIDGKWAKVKLDIGFCYVNVQSLEKKKMEASGGGGGGKMKDIGKSKNPTKFGAICRDGSTDYNLGPNICGNGNGVKVWIYKRAAR